VAAVTAAAWFLISNHCGLALLSPGATTVAAHAHCHQQEPAPLQKGGDEQLPCCKVLRAIVVKESSVAQDFYKFGQPTHYPAVTNAIGAGLLELPVVANELDTGPPIAGSFAELVLQRSILAHAPPFVS
jgi:hypothetical protein